MMEELRNYFISITAAAILCACVRRLAGEGNTAQKVVKLICGLYMAFTVISPVTKIDLSDFAIFTDGIYSDAYAAAAVGQHHTQEAMTAIIKSETEAYILDKARSLGLDIHVSVLVAGDSCPELQKVYISGNVSPYARQQLRMILTQELGIPEEDQQWME